MKVSYWGVRGSIPSPGPETVRYGGETSCVAVEFDDCILVLDAGTGIRHLGCAIASTDKDIYCLISHPHLDHVRGFPFFTPLYKVDKRITLLPFISSDSVWYPTNLMDGILFPRKWKALPSNVVLTEEPADSFFASFPFSVKTFSVNHPGGAVGFVINTPSCSFGHIPDNEISPMDDSYSELKENLKGVTILSHDGQWTHDEIADKRGWGHSSISDLCALASDLEIEKLVIFHHDPSRTDSELDVIGREANEKLMPHGIECIVAYEGLTLNS